MLWNVKISIFTPLARTRAYVRTRVIGFLLSHLSQRLRKLLYINRLSTTNTYFNNSHSGSCSKRTMQHQKTRFCSLQWTEITRLFFYPSVTDVTAKNINLLGKRARAYHARARKHTLTSKHPSNCWTQRVSHRNHPISASTHCISIDFSKKSAVSCSFLPLWGNIPLYTSRGCATKANFDRALVYAPHSLHARHYMPLWETQRRCRKTSFATPPHQFRSIGQITGWLYMTLQRLLVFILFSRKFVHFE